jgi:hypothetical protein
MGGINVLIPETICGESPGTEVDRLLILTADIYQLIGRNKESRYQKNGCDILMTIERYRMIYGGQFTPLGCVYAFRESCFG